MLDCRCLREFYVLAITPTISFICENTEYDLIYLTTYHYGSFVFHNFVTS